MPTVKLHPEGWLSLPDAVRRKLGVGSGDTLELQVVGNSAILRPAKGKAASPEPEPATPEEAAPPVTEEPASPIEPEPVGTAPGTPAPAKRRGRPPKVRS
jgi:bifunctional DNA-binding transcriptional regulator/antitoxin component of YhaV-PrlF toxin-antitoxin module